MGEREGTPDVRLGAALAPVVAGCAGRLAVAARTADGEHRAVYGRETFVAASVVKLDILLALLLQVRDAGREPTGEELAHAEAMITRSDNEAANALWHALGGAAGLSAAPARLGVPDAVPDGSGRWGLSGVTAAGRLALLEAVYGPGGTGLTPGERARVRGLLGRVVAGQRWGVSAAGDPGTGVELKNGWLPRTATGLWVINSVGRVTAGGRDCLLAVLSDGHASREDGIAVVEAAARAAASVLTGLAAPDRPY